MKFSIDRHYCGGQLVKTTISLTGKLASCGMESKERRNSNQFYFENKCCEDQITYYSINSKFISEQLKLSHPAAGKNIPPTPELNVILKSIYYYNFNIRVLPPGDGLKPAILLSQICLLRI